MKVIILATLIGVSIATTGAVSVKADPMPDWTVDIHRQLTMSGS